MRPNTYHIWTRPDERIIERYYQIMTDQEIADMMQLTKMQVTRHRINSMGLKKRPEYRKVA